jgi:hypothetical protein
MPIVVAGLFAFDVTTHPVMGRINIHEIVSSLRVESLPFDLTGVKYFIYLEFEPEECGSMQSIQFRFLGPEGEILATSPQLPHEPIVNPYDGRAYLASQFPVNVVIQERGIYVGEVSVNGIAVHSTTMQLSCVSI